MAVSECCLIKLIPSKFHLKKYSYLYFSIVNGQPMATSTVPIVSAHFRSLLLRGSTFTFQTAPRSAFGALSKRLTGRQHRAGGEM